MSLTWNDLRGLLTATFREWSEDDAARHAAALAYYTVFSLAPLLILVVVAAAQVFDEASARAAVERQMASLVGQPGAAVIREILAGAETPGGSLLATVISLATLIFGASGVFGQLQQALNTIWEVERKPGQGLWAAIRSRFFSFTMVLGVGFLLLVSLVVSTALAAFSDYLATLFPGAAFLSFVVNWIVSLAITAGLFALLYKIVPDVDIAWRDVWLGALATAVLFILGKWLIGLYLGRSASDSTFGAFGSLIALLAWIYYSAQILFLGAEFTQVYANRYGGRIVPDENAVRLDEAPAAAPSVASTVTQRPLVTPVDRLAGHQPAVQPPPDRPGRLQKIIQIGLALLPIVLGFWLRGQKKEALAE